MLRYLPTVIYPHALPFQSSDAGETVSHLLASHSNREVSNQDESSVSSREVGNSPFESGVSSRRTGSCSSMTPRFGPGENPNGLVCAKSELGARLLRVSKDFLILRAAGVLCSRCRSVRNPFPRSRPRDAGEKRSMTEGSLWAAIKIIEAVYTSVASQLRSLAEPSRFLTGQRMPPLR